MDGRENAGEGAKAVTEETKRVARERMAAIFMVLFIDWDKIVPIPSSPVAVSVFSFSRSCLCVSASRFV